MKTNGKVIVERQPITRRILFLTLFGLSSIACAPKTAMAQPQEPQESCDMEKEPSKEEVKESIAGMRSEPQSVDTGNFLNSIQTDLIDKNTSSVNTDVEYAKFLEYGTVNITARQHFRNTEERTKDKVREEIDNAVKKAVE